MELLKFWEFSTNLARTGFVLIDVLSKLRQSLLDI